MYGIVRVCLVDWCPWDSHSSLLVGRGWWEPPSLLPSCISPLVPSPLPLPLSLGGKGRLSLRLAETESSWIGSLVWLVSLIGSAASVSLLRKGRLGPWGRWRLALDTCGYQGPFIRPPCWWCRSSLCRLRDTPCIPVRMELTWSLLLPSQGSGSTRSGGPLFWGGRHTGSLHCVGSLTLESENPSLPSESSSGCVLCHFEGSYLSLSRKRMEKNVSVSIYF